MLKMRRIIGECCLLLLLGSHRPAHGDDAARPTLLEKPTAETILNRQQFLSSGGISFHAADEVAIEPLLGVSHEVQQRELSLLKEGSTHSVTAQAGGKISILEGIYLSAALKYPLYSYQSFNSGPAATSSTGRSALDILNPTSGNLTWTGEVGTTLGRGFSSFLYYDKVTTPFMGGTPGQAEDRIGVRFQFNFK